MYNNNATYWRVLEKWLDSWKPYVSQWIRLKRISRQSAPSRECSLWADTGQELCSVTPFGYYRSCRSTSNMRKTKPNNASPSSCLPKGDGGPLANILKTKPRKASSLPRLLLTERTREFIRYHLESFQVLEFLSVVSFFFWDRSPITLADLEHCM